MMQISIDRTTLELAPLVLTGSRATTPSGLWVPEAGFALPIWEPRYTYAPDSAYVGGKRLLAVVRDQGRWPLPIRAQAASAAALATLRAELETALTQFSFDITLELDGVVWPTWSADYSIPLWQAPNHAERVDHQARASVVIPVNP